MLCSGLSSRSKAEWVLITPAHTKESMTLRVFRVSIPGSESVNYT